MEDPKDETNQSPQNSGEEKSAGIIGASNPTPPSEVLENTPASPRPMAPQPQLEVGSPTKSQQWMKRGKSSLVWAWKVFAELVTIVWLVALWDSYRPKITVTPGVTMNSKSPFATVFIIQNQGSLPISNIRYFTRLTVLPPPWATNQASITRTEQNVSVIPQMQSLESYSLRIQYPTVKVNIYLPGATNQPMATNEFQIGAILLSFDVSYEPKYFGKRTNTLYFTGMTDVDGNWQWLPSAHQSIMDQTIDTNLIPQVQTNPVFVAIPTNGSDQVHANQTKPN